MRAPFPIDLLLSIDWRTMFRNAWNAIQASREDNGHIVTACRCGMAVYRDGQLVKRDYPTDAPHNCKEKRAPEEVRVRR